MADERWHIRYVRDAQDAMAARDGQDAIDAAVKRLSYADREVHEKTLREYGERVEFLPAGEGPRP